MPVTAKFLPDAIDLVAGGRTTMTMRLHNNDQATQTLALRPTGELTEHTKLGETTVTIDPNETLDVSVDVDIGAALPAGTRMLEVEIAGDHGTDTAQAPVNLAAHSEHHIGLHPPRTKGSSSVKHLLRVVNLGNVALTAELRPDEPTTEITLDVDTEVTIEPGTTQDLPVRITPNLRYWNGPAQEHPFRIEASVSDGTDAITTELTGIYEQRPRVPRWLGPAAAGAAAALVVAAVVWFAALAPWVENTAKSAADQAIDDDRAALELRIDELEAAAAEASELPLGTPTDLRLSAAPGSGSTDSDSDAVAEGERLAVTDVIFQNPTGAVGTVSLLRNDEVLLQSELANFRDFDLHFVAPFLFTGPDEITLEVDCRTPGTGGSDCPVAATIVGFVDEVN